MSLKAIDSTNKSEYEVYSKEEVHSGIQDGYRDDNIGVTLERLNNSIEEFSIDLNNVYNMNITTLEEAKSAIHILANTCNEMCTTISRWTTEMNEAVHNYTNV